MTHGSVQRRVLYYPGPNTKGTMVACGVPGQAAIGGAALVVGAGALTDTYPQLAEDSYHRIDLPRSAAQQGPIVAIGIAPDSAIHTCDVALHGQDGELERHRISPGNPLVGCRSDADFALVSIPNSLAHVELQDNEIGWDSALTTVNNGDQDVLVPGFALRLELWRGTVSPIRSPSRAVYAAHAVLMFVLDRNLEIPVTGAQVGALYVCVDGRRRVSVVITADADDAAIVIDNYTANKNPAANTVDPLVSDQLITGTATSAAPFFWDWTPVSGNPLTLMKIQLTIADGDETNCQIHVLAWDD